MTARETRRRSAISGISVHRLVARQHMLVAEESAHAAAKGGFPFFTDRLSGSVPRSHVDAAAGSVQFPCCMGRAPVENGVMNELPATIKHFFPPAMRICGIDAVASTHGGARAVAQAVIHLVGGLKVGEVGPGLVHSASDIEFHQALRLDREVIGRAWRRQFGELVSIADAQHAHIMLFVDSNASFYAFTDPDGKLYSMGPFAQAMETLLLGRDFGRPLDADK